MQATELSQLKVTLDEEFGPKTVGMYGIGVEHFGYDEFKEGNFFSEKIYIDEGKRIYTTLGYPVKKLSNLYGLLEKGFRARYQKSKDVGITGNLKGDGLQLGGTVVVSPEGKVLYHKGQEFYGDDPTNEELFNVIKLNCKLGK